MYYMYIDSCVLLNLKTIYIFFKIIIVYIIVYIFTVNDVVLETCESSNSIITCKS